MKSQIPYRPMAAFVLAGATLLGASQAQAHAHLVSAAPGANTTVAAPRQIALNFSERLEPKFSGAALMKADGRTVVVTSTVADKERKTIRALVTAPLQPGSYTVMWHVVSADGHRMKGDYNFIVR